MRWLVKADRDCTWKRNLCNGTPSYFLNYRTNHVLHREGSHFGFQVVAHEVEFVDAILIGRVECGFCWWQGEDQPAMTRIHGPKPENLAEKCTVRLGVFAVDNHMGTGNHLPSKMYPELIADCMLCGTSRTLNQDQIRPSLTMGCNCPSRIVIGKE